MRKNQEGIAIYSRKSKFTGKGESIGNQIEMCREYIRIHEGKQASKHVVVYEDEGFSGGDLNRPAFKNMMEAVKQRKFKAIVVYRLDRISRNVSDFSSLIEELSQLDTDFVSISENFDTITPSGRAMMSISSVFAQLERETIAERIRDNMHELAKTGRWLGGITPTGYTSEAVTKITIDGKQKSACQLKLIPEEADMIRIIYELYMEYGSLTAVEAELKKRGIQTKNNLYFTRFSIRAILQNPVYAIADKAVYDYFVKIHANIFSDPKEFDGIHGIMAYNRTKQKKGKNTQYLPPEEWIIAVGQHTGMISGKTWITVQSMLERNKCKSYRTPRKNKALLTGHIYCSCGSRMYPKLGKQVNADGTRTFTYVCKRKERSKRSLCNVRNVNGNVLDAAVTEQLKALAENKQSFLQQLEQSRKFYLSNHSHIENQLASLQQQQAAVSEKITGLVDSLARMSTEIAIHAAEQRIEQLQAQCNELDTKTHELEILTSEHTLSELEFDTMRRLLSAFQSSMDDMRPEQKRTVIASLVQKVIWDGSNAHLILFGVPEEEIDPTAPINSCWCEDSE